VKKHSLSILLCAICAYADTYAVLYARRGPAANLAFWVYTEYGPNWAEKSLFYGFYPVYFVHTRALDGARHNWDRRDRVCPLGFGG